MMRAVMTTAGIGRILDAYLDDLEGRDGFWRGTHDDVTVYVFSDDDHDRMRIMAPVGELREPEPRVLQLLLNANYDRALDAHYAMRGLELWTVAVHPLATLAPDDFASYLKQVVTLVKNTGTTYASSDLVFMAPAAPEGEEDEDPDKGGAGDGDGRGPAEGGGGGAGPGRGPRA
uniref:YbjN domain-containing protein n=1 Tax=Eiseniibacteriota bacterium TaxID=2212470 RepID=A0A832MMV9_UNCEI